MNSDYASRAGELNAWLAHTGTAPPAATVLAAGADREHTAGALKSAFIQGRLTKDELSTRAGLALTARTHGELMAAVSGLPGWPGCPGPVPRPRPRPAARTACPASDILVPGPRYGRFLLFWTLAEIVWIAAADPSAAIGHRIWRCWG